MQVRQRIREDVNAGMEKQQREYILRRQLDSIRKELGEDETSVVEEFRQKIAEAAMPDHVREQAERELGRFERMGEQSPEAQTIRSYLDWLLAVPWGVRSEERLDPQATREILDADHAGLEDVKERIVEYIAVRKLREERGIEPDKKSGAILTLIGPPGTGKTSIGESIAASLNREFVRMSLGGMRDEAEIRGHRRTYIGALPGRLVRALARCEDDEPRDPARRGRQGRRRLARRSVRGPARGARPGAELDRSAITTSTSRSTSPRWSSSRRRTRPRRSPGRCSTGWRSSASTATRPTRRSRSRRATSGRGSASGTACARTR